MALQVQLADQRGRAGIDLEAAALDKLRKNAEKYPIEKSYGTSRKYTELDG